MLETNKIYQMDVLEFLKQIDNNLVDLIVVDSPFNMGKDFDNDNLPKKEYLGWCGGWIDECIRILRENGSIYIILGHNVIADIKVLLDKKKLVYRNWITWVFRHGVSGVKNYSYRHEDILFYSKPVDVSEFKRYLNNRRIEKKLKLSDINKSFGVATTGGGCASSWLGDKKDNTIPTISQYYKLKELLNLDNRFDDWIKKKRKGFVFNFDDIAIEPVRHDKRIRAVGKNPGNVWQIDSLVWNHPKKVAHPTQKPLELIKRIIKASSNKGDLVLDCFMGSGTTAVACKQLGRSFIGCDNSQEYVDIANDRLKQEILNVSP